MFRSTTLAPSHYAGQWAVAEIGKLNDLSAVNQLGYDYSILSDCPAKEEMLLQIVEKFHGYLMKYLGMVILGTIPSLACGAGKESKLFLATLLRVPSADLTKPLLSDACKMLHLAFKQMTTEDIYDTLAFILMRAARKYDPFYTDKIRKVCKEIDELPKQFSRTELEGRVDLDCSRLLRLLVRKGFLASISNAQGKVHSYTRSNWPPPAEFFKSGPVGFTYVLHKWFRYYFKEFIHARMSELESKANVLQLDHQAPSFARAGDRVMGSHCDIREVGLPHSEGNCITPTGPNGREYRYMADTTLMTLSLDLSEMTWEWVCETPDKFFRNLSMQQRRLLRLLYVEEKNWREIGEAYNCEPRAMQRELREIMQYLAGHVTFQRAVA